MTEGKDVSVLFTDVVNCMQTHNIELKKLVYLYVMNYAKSQPDRAILAVNTFQKVLFPHSFVPFSTSRMLPILIHLFVPLLYVPWAAFVLTKLWSISLNLLHYV